MPRSRMLWRRYWQRITSGRKCSLQNRRRRTKTDFFKADNSPAWSTITSGSQAQASLFVISLILWELRFRVKQNETQKFRTIEVHFGTAYAGYSAKRRTTQLFPTERHGTQIPGPENKDPNFDARDDAVAKENKETALNGSLKGNVRKVTRAALSMMTTKEERENEEIRHVLLPETHTDLLKRAKDQEASAPPEKETRQFATSLWRENARLLLVISGILLRVPNTKQEKGANTATLVPWNKTKTKQWGEEAEKGFKIRQGNNRSGEWHRKMVMYFSKNRTSRWTNGWIYGRETIKLEEVQSEVFQEPLHDSFLPKRRKIIRIRERKGPSLGMIQGGSRNDRNPNALVLLINREFQAWLSMAKNMQ